MTTLYVKWNGTTLEPASEVDADIMATLPWHKSLKAEVKAPRDLGRHRWFFVFLIPRSFKYSLKRA